MASDWAKSIADGCDKLIVSIEDDNRDEILMFALSIAMSSLHICTRSMPKGDAVLVRTAIDKCRSRMMALVDQVDNQESL